MNRKTRRQKHINNIAIANEKFINLKFTTSELALEIAGLVVAVAVIVMGIIAVMRGKGLGMLFMVLTAIAYAVISVFSDAPSYTSNYIDYTKKNPKAKIEERSAYQHKMRLVLQLIRLGVCLIFAGAVIFLIV